MYDYSGSLHIHSTFSDGSGSVEHITQCANEAGLDYLILTDHNTIEAKEKGYEKWYNNSLLMVGYEINDENNKNHYLVFGMNELVGTFTVLENGELGCKLSAKEYVKLIKEKGGVGFIAHPFEKRSSFPEHPPYPWTEWTTEDFDGIEIWNHMSEWVEDLNEGNKIQRFVHPLKSIVAPCSESVKKWDELNQKKRVSAIGSVDAHAHRMSLLGFYNVEVFPYKVLFKSIRTNVLLYEELSKKPKDFEKNKKAIINALKTGRSYITNNYYGSAKGFRFFAEYSKEKYQMGDDIILNEDNKKITFNFYVPKEVQIKLMRNGECIYEQDGFGGIFDSDKEGVYRLECWINDKAWIFSNHIRVLKNKY